jgi:uncharacterized membrane protein AbrB (regulator of aidB expression)
MKLRKMKRIEISLLMLFVILLAVSALFATVLKMQDISFALLLADFLIAGMVAVFASLSIREEEEEKSQFST